MLWSIHGETQDLCCYMKFQHGKGYLQAQQIALLMHCALRKLSTAGHSSHCGPSCCRHADSLAQYLSAQYC